MTGVSTDDLLRSLRYQLSVPMDGLRQTLWDATERATTAKGPLAVFRSQTDAVPLLAEVLAKHAKLDTDSVAQRLRGQQRSDQPYPIDLFNYLVQQTPQIGGLS